MKNPNTIPKIVVITSLALSFDRFETTLRTKLIEHEHYIVNLAQMTN